MKGFLEQVASYLHSVYGEELSRFCIVFPNIRAGLFFKKHLAALSDVPVWAPAFRSLNSLMENISGLTQADSISLIFQLYQIFRKHRPDSESFEEFYFWGEMLLDDFNDIDRCMVNAHDLFRNVSDLKEIDALFDYLTDTQKNAIRTFWKDFNDGNTSFKTDFSNIWPMLYPVYKEFRQQLRQRGLGYEGLIQREAIRMLHDGSASHIDYPKFVFIGFNALTPCETYFFTSLQKQNRALFFWDYADYYVANTWHEAGAFMRENLRRFPSEFRCPSEFISGVLDKKHEEREIIDPSKITINSCKEASDQSKITIHSCKEVADQSKTTIHSCQEASDQSKLPIHSCNETTDSSKLPIHSCNETTDSSKITIHSCNEAADSSKITIHSCQEAADPSKITIHSSKEAIHNLQSSVFHSQLEIISVPSDTGQTRIAGELLEEISAQAKRNGETIDWSRIAVVLPDEYLLLPMLSALPAAASDINITMGYPFTCTPAYSLFERLASLQQRIRSYADGVRFNHVDVSMILYHPYIRNIVADEATVIINSIIARNRFYVPAIELHTHPVLRLVFKQCTHARAFTNYLLEIITSIAAPHIADPSINREAGAKLEGEYLYSFYTAMQRISDVLAADAINMDVPTFCRLLRKHFAALQIPFSGEPLRGLQLMGMLETRVLDFDRVIILSMNEGVFPRASTRQSYIPYNLRRGFGLTTSERADSISAYHFYRLIQRATRVDLIYNSASGDRNIGEKSRFLSQLIYEPVFNVQQRNVTFSVSIERNVPIRRERTDNVRRVLNMYLAESEYARHLSPSAINSYIDCQMRFYFRYIDGLKQKDEIADEIDHSVFGLLLHKTMELIYLPYSGTEITPDLINRLKGDRRLIENALYRAFAEDYFHTEHITATDITGRNIIIREVLLKYITRILEIDHAAAPFTLLSLEEPLNVRIAITGSNTVARVNMHGYIDRLDVAAGALHIIDYKTGNTNRSFSSIPALFDSSSTGNHAALQTLVYACMTHIARPEYTRITPALYVMKGIFDRDKPYDSRIYITRGPAVDNYFDVAAEFEHALNDLLFNIFLSDEPFTQTPDLRKCRNCIYADICHRN